MNKENIYYQNPDVSCRPEEPEGAILYNPIEDVIELINMSGLSIWRLVQGTTISEMTEKMKTLFEDFPEDQLETDVREFVLHLVDAGFIRQS